MRIPSPSRSTLATRTLLSLAMAAAVFVSTDAGVSAVDDTPPLISDRGLNNLADNAANIPPGVRVNVEIHGTDLKALRELVNRAGGRVYGEVPGFFVEANMPIDGLEKLALDPLVVRVSPVTVSTSSKPSKGRSLQANSPLATTIEDTIQLGVWHDAGYKGAGQRIGILDIFGEAELQAAIAQGRLPTPAGTFCRNQGAVCSITQPGAEPHGVGVAEIIHRTAPEAELYLATVTTTSDLAAAIDWFAQQGVTVINRSETSQFDGPGDGTGPVGSLVDTAVANDMVWVAAAGNAAGNVAQGRDGMNWIGTFNDTDGNGFHEWQNGSELMEFECGFLLGMRWDDWGAGIPTDYDLHIFDTRTSTTPEQQGNRIQQTASDQPFEHIGDSCNSPGDLDYLAIERFRDIQPDGNDQIQILGNFTPMEEWTNRSSATGPGAESANSGAITVGATASPTNSLLASYSSQGPTIDNRANPDLLAPSCLPVINFGVCFTGTSASAPVVSGVIAVLRGSGVLQSAAGAGALIPQITVDRGPQGLDSFYGYGSLSLPPPSAFGILNTSERCRGRVPTIVGTAGNDLITGTEGVDVIVGLTGNDTIDGRGGADIICGNEGRDDITGGTGNDTIVGGSGWDLIRGGAGNDTILAGPGNDTVHGGAGRDTIKGGAGRDTITGGTASDTIDGGAGRDTIKGGTGHDFISGGTGADRLIGNVGNDTIVGRGGNDRISGGAGNDDLRGGAGADRIDGGPGADIVVGGNHSDLCYGGNFGGPNNAGDRLTRCESGA